MTRRGKHFIRHTRRRFLLFRGGKNPHYATTEQNRIQRKGAGAQNSERRRVQKAPGQKDVGQSAGQERDDRPGRGQDRRHACEPAQSQKECDDEGEGRRRRSPGSKYILDQRQNRRRAQGEQGPALNASRID